MSKPVSGFLFDLDGVFYVDDALIPNALDALTRLKAKGIPYRFITNTTTQSSEDLRQKLDRLGIDCAPQELITAPVATATYLLGQGLTNCYFAVDSAVMPDFRALNHTEDNPQAVVIGDIGDAWSYALVDRLFRFIVDGAALVAMHRNKYWQKTEGLHVDIGAFVAGLEYVTGVSATITGKPAPAFFDAAIESLGIPRDETLLVGDDIQSDIGGAQAAGIRALLVKTGKYREELVKASGITPDGILETIADLQPVVV